jgi:hypothetical protein
MSVTRALARRALVNAYPNGWRRWPDDRVAHRHFQAWSQAGGAYRDFGRRRPLTSGGHLVVFGYVRAKASDSKLRACVLTYGARRMRAAPSVSLRSVSPPRQRARYNAAQVRQP